MAKSWRGNMQHALSNQLVRQKDWRFDVCDLRTLQCLKGGSSMRQVIVQLVIVSVVLPALAQEGNEAEKLFRTFEKKLAAAKAVRIALEGTAAGIEDVPGVLKYKGTMVLAEGNKARFEMEVEMEGKKQNSKLVSDGAKMIGEMFEGKRPPKDTPKKFYEEMIGFFKHGGPVAGHVFSSSSEGVRSVATFKASAFKLGKKEKLGKRDAQVIEYKLTLENAPKEVAKLALSEKLWLDVGTNLPLKRVLTGKLNKEFTYTENYSEFTLNPKVDAKLFALPK
jgi:outer membrane lipoprotein-sorting protein